MGWIKATLLGFVFGAVTIPWADTGLAYIKGAAGAIGAISINLLYKAYQKRQEEKKKQPSK